jgi:hypothetical protein
LAPTKHRFPPEHPLWALLLAALPLFFGLLHGPALIDDAHITFRYADNLARGQGFVFNTEPLLGATSPLYCLLLALLRVLGIPPTASSYFLGVAAAAMTPLLLWRIGIAASRPAAGLAGGLLLALMPDWWMNSKTGMETTLAGLLTVLAFLLDLKARPAASGAGAAALVLTRPDAGGFPILVGAKQLLVDRSPRRALRFAAAGIAGALPWLIYAAFAFGSPFPHSLEAKRLIHFMPWNVALVRNFGWLTGIRDGSAGMAILFVLWLAGVFAAMRSWRAGLPLLIWPAVSLTALSLLQIGPFFWYRIPLLPALALGAGLGFDSLRALALSSGYRLAARFAWVLPASVVLLLVAWGGEWVWRPEFLRTVDSKERAMARMAGAIREVWHGQGRDLSSLTVYVGEVGVIAYELPGARVIDSSGINSREVFELRKKDAERLRRENPGAPPSSLREQSVEWSRAVIRTYRPDFIASDERYLHLPELMGEPEFQALYRPVRRWTFPTGVALILLQRTESPPSDRPPPSALPAERSPS